MNQSHILEILSSLQALVTESHIVYTSGKHGSSYINKDALYPHSAETSQLCRLFAEYFAQDAIDIVIAPALGGIILSQWTAHHLSQLHKREVLALYAEKIEGTKDFVIKRGYDKLLPGKNVLVLEDVLTTGGSVKKVIELVRTHGGNVAGLGVLCNRGGVTQEEVGSVPKLQALVSVSLEAWEPEHCPLCAQDIPINTNVGKGREFLEQKKKSY
ncbi:MAG: phosphoribosyltransferase [Verrucomicrobia bacterium]|jgi:orotate phosphoribosyltransferase|nr:MAG: phosphoribosyltransferase [Verrucomicrobiota bacterium]MDH4469723.1 phosphoribosyltransferase family protein [Verrucomicrobiae bacterium]